MKTPSKKVLFVLTHGFEEIEAIAPIDLLRRAGAEVVVAALDAEHDFSVKGRSGIAIRADVDFAKLVPSVKDSAAIGVVSSMFDALVIPGGGSAFSLRKDGRAAALAREFFTQKKLVAAICAAPLILKDAGILGGKNVAAHSCTWEEIPSANLCARVVRDGNVLTSRGPATAFDFGLALVAELFGNAVAEKIASDTMA